MASFGQRSARSTNEPGEERLRVVVRCRPPLAHEEKEKKSLECHSDRNEIVLLSERNRSVNVHQFDTSRSFSYDSVFGPTASQREVYVKSVQRLVLEVIKGFNATIIAYGQTSTGKTYTMEGDFTPSSPKAGIIPQAIEEIFQRLNGVDYAIRVSFLELYNEKLRNLLYDQENLEIRGGNGTNVVVKDLQYASVHTLEDVNRLLVAGARRRATSQTELNPNSSRSHCIFTIVLHMRDTTDSNLIRMGKLHFVDLAGSENVERSGAIQSTLTEAKSINKSLLQLGMVINALAHNSEVVHYRNSNLTRLLQDSLGGTTKTCMIATVTAAASSREETASTLKYALHARNVKSRPVLNIKRARDQLLSEFEKKITALQNQLDRQRREKGVYLEYDEYQRLTADNEQALSTIGPLHEEVAALKRRTGEQSQLTISLEEDRAALASQLAEKNELLSIRTESESRYAEAALGFRGQLEEAQNSCVGLSSKLDRVEEAELRSRQAVNETCQRLQSLLKLSQEKVSDTSSASQAAQEQLSGHLTTVMDLHRRNVEQAREDLCDLAESIAGLTAGMVPPTRGLSIPSVVLPAQKATNEVVRTLTSALHDETQRIIHSLQDVSNCLAGDENLLSDACSALRCDLSALTERQQVMASDAQSALGEMHSALETVHSSLLSHSEAISKRLLSLQPQLEAQRPHMTSEVVEAVSAAVVSALQSVFAKQDEVLKPSIADSKTDLEVIDDTVTNSIAHVMERNEDVQRTITSSVEEHRREADRLVGSLTRLESRAAEQHQIYADTVGVIVPDAMERLDTLPSLVAANEPLGQAKTALERSVEESEAMEAAIVSATRKINNQMEASLRARTHALQKEEPTHRARLEEAGQKCVEAVIGSDRHSKDEQHRLALNEAIELVSNLATTVVPPLVTGGTPPRSAGTILPPPLDPPPVSESDLRSWAATQERNTSSRDPAVAVPSPVSQPLGQPVRTVEDLLPPCRPVEDIAKENAGGWNAARSQSSSTSTSISRLDGVRTTVSKPALPIRGRTRGRGGVPVTIRAPARMMARRR